MNGMNGPAVSASGNAGRPPERALLLSRLRLANFRNFRELDLAPPPGVSVYYGPNAQGKTSLLEAVYLLCIARSFRAENEREVVNFAAAAEGGQALVDGLFEGGDEPLRLIVGYRATPGRRPHPASGPGESRPGETGPPDSRWSESGGGDDGRADSSYAHSRPPDSRWAETGGGDDGRADSSYAHSRTADSPPAANAYTPGDTPPPAASPAPYYPPAQRVHKEIRVNRLRRTAAGMVGLVSAVLFSALDLNLVQGPPAARRRFLDILLSQADAAYLPGLQRYVQVLRQRNRLLRLIQEGRAQAGELYYWDGELVREGAQLTRRRQRVMRQLSVHCAALHRELSGPDETLSVAYRPNIPLPAAAVNDPAADGDGDDADAADAAVDAALESAFRTALEASAGRERAQATTVAGPHRDDIELRINGVDMRIYASRGQARTLALSLRLAEAETLRQARRQAPLVLLDDALSEMDAARRRRVLQQAARYPQTLITTTDRHQAAEILGHQAAYYQVNNGAITPEGG